jgi:serine/threonine protein phosphatase PrpC
MHTRIDPPARLRGRGVFEAVNRPGRHPTGEVYPSGDALFIDARHRFFAVADSPERNPGASRAFLRQLQRLLDELPAAAPGLNAAAGADHNLRLGRALDALIAGVAYSDNTTFTGICLLPGAAEFNAALFHCGDSLFYHFRIGRNEVCQVSQTNHCFVGRIQRVYQAEIIAVAPDSRFLLATDGFNDLLRAMRTVHGVETFKCLAETIGAGAVDRCATRIIDGYDARDAPADDLALIALDPNRWSRLDRRSCIL